MYGINRSKLVTLSSGKNVEEKLIWTVRIAARCSEFDEYRFSVDFNSRIHRIRDNLEILDGSKDNSKIWKMP